MFVGEMGCWIFVGAFHLYRRYAPGSRTRTGSAAEGGYQAVNTQEGEEDTETLIGGENGNPILKAVAVKEDRILLTGWKVLLLSLPAICDICGTTLMNVGLLFVVPSIYQMTRGALVLFVGLFSVIFLRRKLHLFQWFALITVVLGVGIVGLAGAIYKDDKAPPAMLLVVREAVVFIARESRTPEAARAIIGVFLIAGAQIFTASQFVLEEYILENYALEPLKVVGWEGLFGLSVTVLGMLILHLAIGRTDAGRYGYFDVVEGWREVSQIKAIRTSSLLIMISIGFVFFRRLEVTSTNSYQELQLLWPLSHTVRRPLNHFASPSPLDGDRI